MTIRQGDVVEITAERPVAGGRMLARADGRIVLIAGAVPGERVRARIARVTRQVVFADTVEVLDASEDRQAPSADPGCGGLLYRHIRYERQLLLKAEIVTDALRRIARHTLEAPPVVVGTDAAGYRLRARLHVRHGRVGFFREGTHEICDAAATGQLLPEAITSIEAVVRAVGPRLEDVAGLFVAENVRATQRIVHLAPVEGAVLDNLDIDVASIPGLTGVTTSAKRRVVSLAGDTTVVDRAADLLGDAPVIPADTQWSRHATSFFQGHRRLTGALLTAVLEAVDGEKIVDLYAGVGLFAVALAARGASVVAVEGDRSSGEDLSVNAAPFADRILVVRRAVEDAVAGTPGDVPDAVILDPPRTGASPDALDGLLRWRTRRIVYVSCDPPTFARDAARLFSAGYVLGGLQGFDLFPHTPHVEVVGHFERPQRGGA